MTREEYMNLVGKYNKLQREADLIQSEICWAIVNLEDKAELSDDEAEYLEWLREVSSGLDHILN